jgi:uridine phosphorylase
MSTGIGPDNIDIVINELDALVNIDLETRRPKETLTSLNIIQLEPPALCKLIFCG